MEDFDSLWGEEFVIPDTKEKTKQIKEKIAKPKKVKAPVEKQIKSKSVDIHEKLRIITEEVYRILGKQKDNTKCIRTKEHLEKYLLEASRSGIIAIDTETNNSLDPITCKLMGVCLYTNSVPYQVYIPINHRDPDTKIRLENQLTEQDIKEAFDKLFVNPIYTLTHNGKFDYQVLKCTCNLLIPIDWDTFIGAKLLDENERSANLKNQYIEKIDPEQEKYGIEHLFEGVEYADVDPEVFALYAATDSMMTYKLYEWQMNKFRDPDLARVLNLAKTIEMPLVKVVGEMELNGVEFDKEYDERLSKKYHKKLDDVDEKINAELSELKPKIDAWRLTDDANYKPVLGRAKKVNGISYKYMAASGGPGDMPYWYEAVSGRQLSSSEASSLGLNATEQKSKSEQLTDPINLGSPTQLAILFYDVLKAPIVDKKQPRATGEDALQELANKTKLPLYNLLLERRTLVKLITSFIDSLPGWVNPKTGRIHCHFNAYGAATGRFSSSEPNLQQIPSHNHELRLLFKAKDGNILIGSDFSQQEPRVLSQFSQDENMINAYKQGKDLYATIAAGVYKNEYEDNLEFDPRTGQLNPAGKARRGSVKSLLLGIMYGRGVASIAEQIHGTKEDAQKIIDDFFTSFPKVKKWIDKTQEDAHKTGYVEDL